MCVCLNVLRKRTNIIPTRKHVQQVEQFIVCIEKYTNEITMLFLSNILNIELIAHVLRDTRTKIILLTVRSKGSGLVSFF